MRLRRVIAAHVLRHLSSAPACQQDSKRARYAGDMSSGTSGRMPALMTLNMTCNRTGLKPKLDAAAWHNKTTNWVGVDGTQMTRRNVHLPHLHALEWCISRPQLPHCGSRMTLSRTHLAS